MQVSQKKVLQILTNGVFYKCTFNSINGKTKLHFFSEKSFLNLPLYLKSQNKLMNINNVENNPYRKKYFN